jgi:hypothetical protein
MVPRLDAVEGVHLKARVPPLTTYEIRDAAGVAESGFPHKVDK